MPKPYMTTINRSPVNWRLYWKRQRQHQRMTNRMLYPQPIRLNWPKAKVWYPS